MRPSSLFGLALIVAAGCAPAVVAPLPVGPVIMRAQPEEGAAAFLGSAACAGCHVEQYARWRAGGHARDFAGLLPADRSVTACLRCHVTGYGERNGYRAGADPDLSNVGCEACHGPGADHGRSAHPGLVPTLTGGACPPCEVNRICRLCHTPERSPKFDLDAALTAIGCKR